MVEAVDVLANTARSMSPRAACVPSASHRDEPASTAGCWRKISVAFRGLWPPGRLDSFPDRFGQQPEMPVGQSSGR